MKSQDIEEADLKYIYIYIYKFNQYYNKNKERYSRYIEFNKKGKVDYNK